MSKKEAWGSKSVHKLLNNFQKNEVIKYVY